MNAPLPDLGLTLQPMVHVENMAASVAFYRSLGATVVQGSPDGDFVLLALGSSQFSLLAHPPNPAQNEGVVELNFEASQPLTEVRERLQERGFQADPPVVQDFGAQLQVTTPDGLLIKINHFGPPS